MGPFCIFAEIRSNSSIKNKLKQLMSNSKNLSGRILLIQSLIMIFLMD